LAPGRCARGLSGRFGGGCHCNVSSLWGLVCATLGRAILIRLAGAPMPLLDGAIQFLGFHARHDLRKLQPMSTNASPSSSIGAARRSPAAPEPLRQHVAALLAACKPGFALPGALFTDERLYAA